MAEREELERQRKEFKDKEEALRNAQQTPAVAREGSMMINKGNVKGGGVFAKIVRDA